PAYESFCRFAFYPLILMARGHERIARRLLPEYEGVRESDVRALTGSPRPTLPRSALGYLATALRRIRLADPTTDAPAPREPQKLRPADAQRRADFLQRARAQVEA